MKSSDAGNKQPTLRWFSFSACEESPNIYYNNSGQLLSQAMIHKQQPLYLPRLYCTLSFDVTHVFKHIKFYVKSFIFAQRVVVCPAYSTVPPDDLDLLCSLDGHKQTKDKENQFEGSVGNDPSLMVTTCWTAGQMYAPPLWCACCIDLCIFLKKWK